MAVAKYISKDEDFDKEVELSDIYSVREAYLQLPSYTKYIITEFKAINHRDKNISSDLDSLTKRNLEFSKSNDKLEENKKLSQALKDKNVKVKEIQKDFVLLKEKIGKRNTEDISQCCRKYRKKNSTLRKIILQSY